VRDLARACALFVIHAQPGAPIDLALIQRCLPEVLQESPNPKAGPLLWSDLSFRDAVRQFERELLLARLEHHGGSVKAARESLELSKATFHRYLKGLGISNGGSRTEE
jgi:DNA-binding NtrC family response regulator